MVQPPSWRVLVNALGQFVIALAATLVGLGLMPLIVGMRPVLVTSGSMEPALRAGDIVMTQPPDGLVGPETVIQFDTPSGSVIHRVLYVIEDGYVTRGDANPTVDSTIVEPDAVEGVGVMIIPLIGHPQLWWAEGRWGRLAALAAIVVAAVVVSSNRWLAGDGSRVSRWGSALARLGGARSVSAVDRVGTTDRSGDQASDDRPVAASGDG